MKNLKQLIILVAFAILAMSVDDSSNTSSRPFWGDECGFVGVVGGIGGSPCYEYYICTKYRVWINFGSYDSYTEVECPGQQY